MTRYDFTETVTFLKEIDLANLYLDVCNAMSHLSCATKYQDRETIREIWHTLLTCADFLDTIQIKKGGKP